MDGSCLQITGAWTKAGIASCVRVQGLAKQDDFLFDCGVFEPETQAARAVFVSHGHIDHVGACISHARGRALRGPPAAYYVPVEIYEALNEAKAAFEKMDGKPIGMNIVPFSPGDQADFGSNLRFRAFSTVHRVASQGYAVYSYKRGELLPELRGASPEEIKRRKQAGENILTPETERLEMVYTGDTTFAGLLNPSLSFIFSAPVLITELTFLDGDYSKAMLYGHIHLQDVLDNRNIFKNKQIVFVHVSQKYSLSRVLRILRDTLPMHILCRVSVSLFSFGSNEVLSRLTDDRWANSERSEAGWGWSSGSSGKGSIGGTSRQQDRRQTYGFSTTPYSSSSMVIKSSSGNGNSGKFSSTKSANNSAVMTGVDSVKSSNYDSANSHQRNQNTNTSNNNNNNNNNNNSCSRGASNDGNGLGGGINSTGASGVDSHAYNVNYSKVSSSSSSSSSSSGNTTTYSCVGSMLPPHLLSGTMIRAPLKTQEYRRSSSNGRGAYLPSGRNNNNSKNNSNSGTPKKHKRDHST